MYAHEIGRMPAEPHGAALIATPPSGPASGRERMVRQERREVRAHADRADARTAAAVRDAERLVQVEVRHVGAELARPRDTDQRVEVRAVEVHLAAVVVHDRADVADALLEHAVRRRVRDHQRRELLGVLRGLRLEVVEVDVAVVVARDDDDAHAGHRGRRRVGAVRRRRDQAHVALGLAARRVVAADREQARVLALRAGVRLQRHRVVAGDLGEPAFEVVDQLEVAADLLDAARTDGCAPTRAT